MKKSQLKPLLVSLFLFLLISITLGNKTQAYTWNSELIIGAKFDYQIVYTVDGKSAMDSYNNITDDDPCTVEIKDDPLFPCSLNWVSIKVDGDEINEDHFIVQERIIEFFLLPIDFLENSIIFNLTDNVYIHQNITGDKTLEIKINSETGVLHSFFFSQPSENGIIILKLEQSFDKASFSIVPSFFAILGLAIISATRKTYQGK